MRSATTSTCMVSGTQCVVISAGGGKSGRRRGGTLEALHCRNNNTFESNGDSFGTYHQERILVHRFAQLIIATWTFLQGSGMPYSPEGDILLPLASANGCPAKHGTSPAGDTFVPKWAWIPAFIP